MREIRTLAPAAALLAVLLAGCASGPDPTQVRLDNLDARVSKLERVMQNGSLVELAQQQTSLRSQVRDLRGRLDDLERTNKQLRQQQHDLYADLNKRLGALEHHASSAPAKGGADLPGALPGVTPVQQSVYGQAFDALKAGSYTVAIHGFEGFLKTYPASPIAPNAQYWLGEAHYVNQDYAAADKAFRTVFKKWPNSNKAPDAMLDLGNALIAQGKTREGHATLRRVIKRFPGSDAAQRAAGTLGKPASH